MGMVKAFLLFVMVVNMTTIYCAFNDWFATWARNQQPDYARIMPASGAQWDSIQAIIRNGMQSTLSLDKLDPLSGVREGVVADHGTYTARSVGIPIVAFRGLSKIDVPLTPSGSTIHVDPSFSLTLSITNGIGARKPTFIMISPEGDTGLSVVRGILAGKGYAVVAATFRGTGNNRVLRTIAQRRRY